MNELYFCALSKAGLLFGQLSPLKNVWSMKYIEVHGGSMLNLFLKKNMAWAAENIRKKYNSGNQGKVGEF